MLDDYNEIFTYFDYCHLLYGSGALALVFKWFSRKIPAILRGLHLTLLIGSTFLWFFEFLYFSIVIEVDTLKALLLGIQGVAAVCGCLVGFLFLKDAESYRKCLLWCKKWTTTSVGGVFNGILKENFEFCAARSRRMLKQIVLGSVATFVAIHIGQMPLKSLLNWKLTLVFPIYIPFYPPDTYPSFFVNFFLQAFAAVNVAFAWAGMFGTVAVTFEHLKTLVKTLNSVMETIRTETRSQFINETLKVVAILHCEWIECQKRVIRLTSGVLFVFELCSVALVMVFWTAVVIAHTEYATAAAALGMFFIYSVICVINESIGDSYESLGDTLYDLEWYNMPVKERRTIWFMQIAMQKVHLLTAGPFEVANLEHLYKFLKNTYSYCLCLNNVIKKILGLA